MAGITLSFVPKFSVPLNSSECMCESITEYAQALYRSIPLNRTCVENSRCDGLRCSVTLNHGLYYEELAVLPCASPPALVFGVKNSSFVPLGRWTFVDSANHSTFIDNVGREIGVSNIIERGPRSITSQVYNYVHRITDCYRSPYLHS